MNYWSIFLFAFFGDTKRTLIPLSQSATNYPGFDMRYYNSTVFIENHNTTIREYLWKQRMLDVFMDPKRSMYEKMDVYEQFHKEISPPDLWKGLSFDP